MQLKAMNEISVDLTGFQPEEAGQLLNYVLIEYLSLTDDEPDRKRDIVALFDCLQAGLKA